MPALVHAQLHELVRTRVTRVGNFAVAHVQADFPDVRFSASWIAATIRS